MRSNHMTCLSEPEAAACTRWSDHHGNDELFPRGQRAMRPFPVPAESAATRPIGGALAGRHSSFAADRAHVRIASVAPCSKNEGAQRSEGQPNTESSEER